MSTPTGKAVAAVIPVSRGRDDTHLEAIAVAFLAPTIGWSVPGGGMICPGGGLINSRME